MLDPNADYYPTPGQILTASGKENLVADFDYDDAKAHAKYQTLIDGGMNPVEAERQSFRLKSVPAILPKQECDAPPVRAILTRLSDVVIRPVEWMWQDIFAKGKISLIIGDPGVSKSYLMCDLASRISSGAPWPNDPFDTRRIPQQVIMFNAEDGLDDTTALRLKAAGAKMENILAFEGVEMTDPETKKKLLKSFNFERDTPRLKEALEQNPEVVAVFIDPISAYMGGTDSHKNSDVRGLLAPLATMASDHNVAIILVSHLNKSGGSKSVYRCNGSLAFPAAARAVWLVAKDEAFPDRRLFLNVKNNLARNTGGLAYQINTAGKLEWEDGPVTMLADDVLGQSEQPSKCESAEQWLRDFLADGPKPVKECEAEAKAAGIAQGTLRRARESLGIRPEKTLGFGGGWTWGMTPQNKGAQQGAQSTPIPTSCAPCTPLDNTPKNTHFNTQFPARDQRCANGRETGNDTFDESGEPYQRPKGNR